MPSVANTVGTDLSKYKIVKTINLLVYHALFEGDKTIACCYYQRCIALVSPAYPVFEIMDHEELDPEYLMMWFRRLSLTDMLDFIHGSVERI